MGEFDELYQCPSILISQFRLKLLVLAGIGDILQRPPQNVSLNQSSVLAATGLVWSRYSVVIIPKNYSLLSVNFVVFLTQAYLIGKHLKWRYANSKNTA